MNLKEETLEVLHNNGKHKEDVKYVCGEDFQIGLEQFWSFANHKDFRIESHKQYFPFEKDGCCAYMAVLTKLDHEEADPFGAYAAKIAKDGKKE